MKVVLIEDQQLLSSTLANALGQMPDLEVVARSDKATDAVPLCAAHAPDLVIMDIFTREGNGIECTAQLKRAFPAVKVLILTGVEDDRLILAAQDAGADLFARKSMSLEELTELVRYSQRPYRVFPNVRPETAKAVRFSELELRVIRLLAQGKSAREIADALYLGYGTIRVYISHMYAATGMKSRAQLVAYALRCGLIDP